MKTRSKSIHVTLAISTVVVLTGLLAVRLVARTTPPVKAKVISAEEVSDPETIVLGALDVPCWWCEELRNGSLSFHTNLDLLAPLGKGRHNAAEWFVDFSKPNGPRYEEAAAAMSRRIDGGSYLKKILAADDPLLAEAEPWCDQATMRFYPDYFALEGPDTQLPNMLIPLTFAKSWVARGDAQEDVAAAMQDYRRAVRLGRLLRQEDAFLITDLVGLACIRFGAEAIYERARQSGETELALVAAIAVGEVAPQRFLSGERITRVDLKPYLRLATAGEYRLELPDSKLDVLVEMATSSPDRRFRGEVLTGLEVVRVLGTEPQQQRALEVLEELARDRDDLIAAGARWALTHEPGASFFEDIPGIEGRRPLA